jgi:predicted transcriptional regulator
MNEASIKKLETLKRKQAALERQRDQDEGRLKQITTQLKEEYGFNSIEDAQAGLKAAEKEAEKAAEEFEEAVGEFEDKWGDAMNEGDDD